MCVKNPDLRVFEESLRRIRGQPEVGRIVFVAYPTLSAIDFIESNIKHGDGFIYDTKGLACARYLGIQATRSKYIGFVDHDVFVPKNYYERLLAILEANPQVGGIHGEAMDIDLPKRGMKMKPPNKFPMKVDRGLCTANLIRRELVSDWRPPRGLQAYEDFHLTQHIYNKGYFWVRIPLWILHLSFGDDMEKRWLWVGAGLRFLNSLGFRFVREAGRTCKIPFLLKRLQRIILSPRFAMVYGTDIRALWFEIKRQLYLIFGYFNFREYLKSKRTGYERL